MHSIQVLIVQIYFLEICPSIATLVSGEKLEITLYDLNLMATRMLYNFRLFTMLIYSNLVYGLYKIRVKVHHRQLSAQCLLTRLAIVTTS